MNASIPTAAQVLDAVLAALRQFGQHTFTDKGPQETMDIGGLAERLRRAEASEAARVLRELAHSGPDPDFRRHYATMAAGAIVNQLQTWDELFEQPGIVELYDNEIPELEPGDSPAREAAPKAARRSRPR